MAQFDTTWFRVEVAKYLEQYMNESNDINYLSQTRGKIIAQSGEPDLKNATPNLFPLGRSWDKRAALGTFNDYFIDYIESRGLSKFDQATLTQEAKRLARLLLVSVTEIATVILMIDMALAKWVERTPRHKGLIANMYSCAWSAIYKRSSTDLAVVVTFWTPKKTTGRLVINFIDEVNSPKLLSETDKHIYADYSTFDNSLITSNISWEELPKFIKSKILTDK